MDWRRHGVTTGVGAEEEYCARAALAHPLPYHATSVRHYCPFVICYNTEAPPADSKKQCANKSSSDRQEAERGPGVLLYQFFPKGRAVRSKPPALWNIVLPGTRQHDSAHQTTDRRTPLLPLSLRPSRRSTRQRHRTLHLAPRTLHLIPHTSYLTPHTSHFTPTGRVGHRG